MIERNNLLDDFDDMTRRRTQSYETACALARELNSPVPSRPLDIFNDYELELEPGKWICWAFHIGGASIATHISNACGLDRELAWEWFLETISSNIDQAIADTINEVIGTKPRPQASSDYYVCRPCPDGSEVHEEFPLDEDARA